MRFALRCLGSSLVVLALTAATYANPVLPGDHPDPTIVHARGAYYLSATTSAWAPLFPIFRSTDLVDWREVGAVLPVAPRWANGRFWAPELSYDRGRFVAFYSASRARGGACIGVATAARAEGPWRDRGRAACPPGGAIDPFAFGDGHGARWLAWKARGPFGAIRVQRLDARGLRVRGRATVAIHPDQPWEQDVTEGPAIVRRGATYYLFYAGGHCCRPPCTYAEGVARAPAPTGPWEKAPGPVLAGNGAFRCPGHGTVLDLGTRGLWLVHHAYAATDLIDARREVLLTRLTFGPDGWPAAQGGPPAQAKAPLGRGQAPVRAGFSDGFDGAALEPGWEWLFDAAPATTVRGGELDLRCRGGLSFVARQVPVDRWVATATVDARAPRGGADVGLAANLGRGVRGVELTRAGARAFTASPRGIQAGPPLRLGRARTVRLAVSVAPGGALATYAAAGSAPLRAVPPGPAARGSGPTRIALTCRHRGAARFTSARVRPLVG
jgi:xylan 1,4-beta-xylosidase